LLVRSSAHHSHGPIASHFLVWAAWRRVTQCWRNFTTGCTVCTDLAWKKGAFGPSWAMTGSGASSCLVVASWG
jgi:hypothetical protein